MVLEKALESPLDSKEIKRVNLKGNQPWILIGRTDAEAETPLFWSSDVLTQEKCLTLVKIEGRRRRCLRMRWLDGITNTKDLKLGQTLGGAEGQRGLVCCSLWGCKSWTWLGDWTTITIHGIYILSRVLCAIQ